MGWRIVAVLSLMSCVLPAVVIDQIAVVVGRAIVKDSDIDRDLRVTEFLNGDRVSENESARKAAVNRLIDQAFIRREIQVGDYPGRLLRMRKSSSMP